MAARTWAESPNAVSSKHVQLLSRASMVEVPWDSDASEAPPKRRLATDLAPTDCVCPEDEYCSECAVVTPLGGIGHTYWDEVEMLRHGWCDKRGHHWSKSACHKDEAEMLHDGMVSRLGRHQSYQAGPVCEDESVARFSNSCPRVNFAPHHQSTKISSSDSETSSAAPVHLELHMGGSLSLTSDGTTRVYELSVGDRHIRLECGGHTPGIVSWGPDSVHRLHKV